MAFTDTKSIGDIIDQDDWNDFVDFTEDISSQTYWISSSYAGHSSNTDIHFPSSQITPWLDGLYAPSGVSGDTSSQVILVSGMTSTSNIYHDGSTARLWLQYASSVMIGTPGDGDLTGGTLSWTESTKVTDALDDINEILAELAPADANPLAGTLANNRTEHSGKLASSSTYTYKSGEGPGTYKANYIYDDTTITFTSPSQSDTFNKADEGYISCYINGTIKGKFSLSSNFEEAYRSTSQDYTPSSNASGNINISDVSQYNSFNKWQKGNFNSNALTFTSHFVNGYNSIYYAHEGITSPVSTSTYEFFYDTLGTAPDMQNGSVTCTENSLASAKWRSGIRFYSTNDTFKCGGIALHCFESIYGYGGNNDRCMKYDNTNFPGTTDNQYIDYTHTSGSGVDTPPVTGQTFTLSAWPLTINVANQWSSDARVQMWAVSPYGTNTENSASEGRLVDTYGDAVITVTDQEQNDAKEHFRNEYYRLSSASDDFDGVPSYANLSGQWDSTIALTNGSSQIWNGRLYYPTVTGPNSDGDFSAGCLPTNTADYSGFTGVQKFYRAFIDSGNTHSNCVIEMSNLTTSEVQTSGSGDINVEIKLPSQTGWMDISREVGDGSGCKVSYASNQWTVSFLGKSTSNSGWMIIMRILIRNSNNYVDDIEVVGWS